MKDLDINWALAFACLAFSGTWLVGLAAQVPVETAAVRATVALFLGAAVGWAIDYLVRQLAPLAAPPALPRKGSRVNFTTPDEAETPPPLAPAQAAEAAFQPLDFKSTARHVETIAQD